MIWLKSLKFLQLRYSQRSFSSIPALSLLVLESSSGSAIGLCPIISDNENSSCRNSIGQPRKVTHASSAVAKLAATASQAPSLRVPLFSPDHVFPVQFIALYFALPLFLCLLRISSPLPFCYDLLPASGFTIGLCPINSDNNDSPCLSLIG